MFLVLKAKFTDNEKGLPPEWPVKANPAKEGEQPPIGWIKLSKQDLEALKRKHQNEYDLWKDQKNEEEKKRKEEKEVSEKAPSKSAAQKLRILGFNEIEIQKILGSEYVE